MLFNLFPGMGAWNYTIRKAGFAVANDMVLSGKLYTAEQLYRRSLVDLVVDDGQGEAALDHVVRSIDPACAARWSRCKASAWPRRSPTNRSPTTSTCGPRRRSRSPTRDLRLMERLARAQVRKVGGADEGALHEIKRIELDTAWGEERTGITEWTTARAEAPDEPAGSQPGGQQAAELAARVGLAEVAIHPGFTGANGVVVEGVGGERDDRQAAPALPGLAFADARGWRRSRPSPASGSP